MALSFVDNGSPTAANSSPQSPVLPASSTGDTLLMFCIQSSASGVTFTPPGTWTSLARNSNATRSMTIEVFGKIQEAGESDPSVSCSSAASGWLIAIGAWRGGNRSTIEDATEVASDAAAAATLQPTGITTASNGAWVVSFVGTKDDNSLTQSTANGFTERMSGSGYDDTVGSGSDYSIGVSDKNIAIAGAATCPTWQESVNGNDAWVALTLALKPADDKTVTPGVLALTTTSFAPTVSVGGGGITVTPGKLSLTTTAFAPSVLAPRLVTPPKLSLTTTAFAPSVLAPRLVTPPKLSLTLTTFAPTVTASGGSVTATITRPGESIHLTNYTVEQFDGWSSTSSVDIKKWHWDFGDGTTMLGPNAYHVYTSAGTRTVTLTVTDVNGNTDTDTVSITTADFSGTDVYIANSGDDTTGNGTSGNPYATVEKALAIIGGGTQNAPKRCLAKKGDTFNWTATGHQPDGPVLFDSWGSGAAPIVNVTGQIISNVTETYGYAVIFANWDIRYASAQGEGGHLNIWAAGSGLIGCTVTNTGIVWSGGAGDGVFVVNCTISGGDYLGMYSNENFTCLAGSTLFGHGADNSHHHQVYWSNFSHGQVRDCEFYAGSGVAYSGCKTSGIQKLTVDNCYAHDNSVGFDAGANTGDDTATQVIYTRNRIFDNNLDGSGVKCGIWIANADGFWLFNNLIAGSGSSGRGAITIIHSVNDCRMYGNVLYDNDGSDLEVDGSTTAVTNIEFKNNIVHRLANCDIGNDKAMINCHGGSLDDLDSDYNFFYASSPATDTSSTQTFNADGDADTFSEWQAASTPQDAHSTFGNPGMTSPSTHDFSIGSGSATKDAGTTLAILYDDYLSVTRPQGSAYDVGAYEFASGNVTATPGTLSLVTTKFAPTVIAPRLVTPGKLSLSTSAFAPVVSTPRLVTPGKLSLVTTAFAPTVTIEGDMVVVPGTLAIVLTRFAPVVTASGGGDGGSDPSPSPDKGGGRVGQGVRMNLKPRAMAPARIIGHFRR